MIDDDNGVSGDNGDGIGNINSGGDDHSDCGNSNCNINSDDRHNDKHFKFCITFLMR